MTALRDLLELPSFATALRAAADLAEPHRGALVQSLGDPTTGAPEGLDLRTDTSWRRMVSALTLAYDTKEKEGLEEVLQDIESSDSGFTEKDVQSIRNLLHDDPVVREQLEGVRQRDRFLPIFQGISLALDLRVLDLESGAILAPVVTARMHFDEPIAGTENVVFQIPGKSLNELIARLDEVRHQLRGVRGLLEEAIVPEWATTGLGDALDATPVDDDAQ
ncbi:hypothetical protein [Paenarthrobacter aromaticivorans]|uniref:Uncharacterized protein n=1 Tax=Paenarthrobacter aromaticivorans TaxID=2849150 RepID=A0ABS6I9Q5_9MICC|nr:hypothetical protein [Paenarthrobacter sp. MMS21-TAE1-1]MBU8868445.1 hypothetical protein [Paenarthrobacter sp. MMS21-TAE1-1]